MEADRPSTSNSRRLLDVTLSGAIVAAGIGFAETALLHALHPAPQVDLVLRRVLVIYGAAGAVLGLVLGLCCEGLLCRGLAWRRRTFYRVALPVLCFLPPLLVYTHSRLRSSLAAPASHALLGLAAAAALAVVGSALAWARRRQEPPSPGSSLLPRPFLALSLATAGLALVWPMLRSRSPAPAGSVCLIVLDTTRADRLSAYGYERPTTPALERLAREGVLFSHAFAPAPTTLQSHASMFTGHYTAVHQAHGHLDERLPTLAEHLADLGLATAAVHEKAWLAEEVGILRGFQEVFDLRLGWTTALEHLLRLFTGPASDAGARDITRTAIHWLDRHADRPFFLFLNYNEAHSPYEPVSPYREQYLGERSGTPWGREKRCSPVDYNLGLVDYGAADFAAFSDLYDAEIAYQDRFVGELVDWMRARGILDDTLLIVTADHGESFGAKDFLGHGWFLYHSLLHVPLIVRHPALASGGTVVDTPVEIRRLWSLIDRFLAHGDAGPLSPEELAAVLCEDPAAGGPVIAEYRAWQPATAATLRADDPAGRARHFRQPLRSVQVGDLKYVRGIDGSEELYDVRRDPGELHDLAAESPEVLGRLRELMDRCFASLGTTAPAEDRPLSSELTEELKALGYLR